MAKTIWVGPHLMWDPSSDGPSLMDDRLALTAESYAVESKAAPQTHRTARSVIVDDVRLPIQGLPTEEDVIELWTLIRKEAAKKKVAPKNKEATKKRDAKIISEMVREHFRRKKFPDPNNIVVGDVLI